MILALVMALALVACGNKNTDDGKKDGDNQGNTPTVITNPDEVQDEMTSSDGKYEVAFVTDVGQLKDKSFNQGTYDGVKLYAANNNLSYKYYQPANGSEATDEGKVIGVDVDQSGESPTVITSAMKGLADSAQWALGKFYAGEFASIGGVQTSLGANENAVGLPTATWSLTKWSVDDYNTKLQEIKDGKIAIDNNYDNLASTENLTLNIVG